MLGRNAVAISMTLLSSAERNAMIISPCPIGNLLYLPHE
jgi:hypothetical protein